LSATAGMQTLVTFLQMSQKNVSFAHLGTLEVFGLFINKPTHSGLMKIVATSCRESNEKKPMKKTIDYVYSSVRLK
jgi:hypothetical protein